MTPAAVPYAGSVVLLSLTWGCVGDISTPEPATLEPAAVTPRAPEVWLPTRVRRLSSHELDLSVIPLLQTSSATPLSTALTADIRQSGYTMNAGQRIDGTLASQLWTGVEALGEEATLLRLSQLAPCGAASTPRACAIAFIDSFGTRAFRRPLLDEERSGLLAVFDTAMTASSDAGYRATFGEGISAVIQAALLSGSFLYLTELGVGDGPRVELEPYEVASAISYLVTGAAPDALLLEAAARGELRTADQREAQVRRLMASGQQPSQQLARFVREWLGLDRVTPETLRKLPPGESFASLVPSLHRETELFVSEVVAQKGTLRTLLTADFTVADATLARHYGLPSPATGFARADLSATPRRGILTQANFLASFATEKFTSPVQRGKALLDQLLCLSIHLPADPAVLEQAMTSVPENPNATTRERFVQHSSVPACASCHQFLDPLGFAFEQFDHVGRFRELENGKPIDASGTLVGTDVNGDFQNAKELAGRLAESEQVARCFARNFFRFASAQTSSDTEAQYLDVWNAMPASGRQELVELLVGYTRSEMFVQRRTP